MPTGPTSSTSVPPAGGRRPARRAAVRLGGVPVRLNPSWPVSLAIVVAVMAVLARRLLSDRPPLAAATFAVGLALLLMLGVLLHEFGHCWAARWAGQRVLGIRFDVLGGQTDLAGVDVRPGRDALVAAAGPAMSGLLALIAWLVAQPLERGSIPWLLAMAVTVVNALLAVFNLLPALPLDGGEVLRAMVSRVTGRRSTGTRVAFAGTAVVCGALLLLAVIWLLDGSRDGPVRAIVLAAVAVHLATIGIGEWRTERRFSRSGSGRQPDRTLDGVPPDDDTGHDSDVGTVVLLPDDGPDEFRAALRHPATRRFVLVDEDGVATQVWSRIDLARILSDRGGPGDRATAPDDDEGTP